jgi:hypothetical protein
MNLARQKLAWSDAGSMTPYRGIVNPRCLNSSSYARFHDWKQHDTKLFLRSARRQQQPRARMEGGQLRREGA